MCLTVTFRDRLHSTLAQRRGVHRGEGCTEARGAQRRGLHRGEGCTEARGVRRQPYASVQGEQACVLCEWPLGQQM